MLSFSIFALLVLSVVSLASGQLDADIHCFKCKERKNNKDLYEHPTDCHKYVQCFYSGEDGAIGIVRDCPPATFWNERILQCTPEGSTPCVDKCRDEAVDFHGCYADPTSCSSFFQCSNWASYHYCCPPKSVFNPATCNCEESTTCNDPCVRVGPPSPTTAPPQVFADSCIDSWGSTLKPDPSPNFYLSNGVRMPCAPGTTFNLGECGCTIPVEVTGANPFQQCLLYLGFNGNTKDSSVYNFKGDLVGNAETSTTVSARGSGSLKTSGGWFEMPFTKTATFFRPEETTFCTFFRCENPPCTYDSGTIVSDREGPGSSNYGCIKYLSPNNTLKYDVTCRDGTDAGAQLTFADPLSAPLAPDSPNGFSHYCYTANSTHRRIHINKVKALDGDVLPCEFKLTHCPTMLGFDFEHGPFNGYLDEFMICPFDIGEAGVLTHFQGEAAVRAAGWIP